MSWLRAAPLGDAAVRFYYNRLRALTVRAQRINFCICRAAQPARQCPLEYDQAEAAREPKGRGELRGRQ